MARKQIDVEKVSPKYRHIVGHKVDYWLYTAKEKTVAPPKGEEPPGLHCTGVCFSRFKEKFDEASQKPNRIYYPMPTDPKNLKLTLKEKQEYVKMCRKNHLLPKYFKYDWMGEEESKIVLDISDIPPSLVYAYLCNFRYVREDPGFVRALVYLVNTKEMNFYVAYVLTSKVCLFHGGHVVLEPIRGYLESSSDPNDVNISVARMAGLYRFVRDAKKYDNRTMYSEGKSYDFWQCNKTIKSACKASINIHVKNAFSPKLGEIISLKKDANIEKELEAIG